MKCVLYLVSFKWKLKTKNPIYMWVYINFHKANNPWLNTWTSVFLTKKHLSLHKKQCVRVLFVCALLIYMCAHFVQVFVHLPYGVSNMRVTSAILVSISALACSHLRKHIPFTNNMQRTCRYENSTFSTSSKKPSICAFCTHTIVRYFQV